MKSKNTNIIALLNVASISFLGILTETSLNVSYTQICKDFNVKLNVVQWITSGYLLTIAILMIGSSYFNERFSAKELFSFSSAAFLIGTFLCMCAPNFELLLLGRIISACGAGICTPLMFNLIVELVPGDKIGFYMGLTGLVISLAPALGPFFGGIVTYIWNWRIIFGIVTVLGSICLVSGLFFVKKYHSKSHPKLDWIRYFILAMSFVSLSMGLNLINSKSDFILSIICLIIFLIFVCIFVKLSKNSQKKLLNIEIFRNSKLVCALIGYFLLQMVDLGSCVILPTYSEIVNHATTMVAGLILLPGSFLAAVLNPWFGKIYDKKGPKLPLFMGSSIMLAGTVLLAISQRMNSVSLAVFFTLLICGETMTFNNTLAEAIKLENKSLHSDVTSVFQTSQQYAGSIGTILMTSIVSRFQNGVGNIIDLTAKGTSMAFWFASGCGIIILTCFAIMFRRQK